MCPAKYRAVVFDRAVEEKLREICLEIQKRFSIYFVEVGTDRDHVHFLLQSIPTYQPTKIVRVIKSITAREIFRQLPQVKKKLWGGEFWGKGYYIATVGRHSSETAIQKYVKNQGVGVKNSYTQIHKGQLKIL